MYFPSARRPHKTPVLVLLPFSACLSFSVSLFCVSVCNRKLFTKLRGNEKDQGGHASGRPRPFNPPANHYMYTERQPTTPSVPLASHQEKRLGPGRQPPPSKIPPAAPSIYACCDPLVDLSPFPCPLINRPAPLRALLNMSALRNATRPSTDEKN